MAEVKWIKLSTRLPDSRKIKQIRRLPEGDTIALMWIFLMCLAGETNESGMIYFTPEIPYTDEMLADQFNMDIGIVRVALKTFQRFGMLEIVDDIICLSSWEKWQSTDRLAEIREYNRIKKQESRARKKLLEKNVNDMSMTSQSSQDTDIDIEKERDLEKDNNKYILSESDKKKAVKPSKHKYGEYNNVLLTDEELQKLQAEYPDCEERIERLSSYIVSTGKAYKSHYATIRNWARKDAERPQQQQIKKTGFNNYSENRQLNDFERRMLEKRMNPPATAGTDENIMQKVIELKKKLGTE